MEISKELVEQLQLNEDQVKGITDFTTEQVATLKNEWDGKANENAEKILDGAASYFKKQTGLTIEREKGEKYADFIKRASDTYLENQKTEVHKLKSDYEAKIKDFKGGDATKAELEKVKSEYDEALKKLANYDELTEKASKYEEASQTLSTLKLEVAFGKIKPSFPKEVNEYEAKAKWENFKKDVLDKYTIELVDNEAIAIDKENKHRTLKLDDLVKKDETIQELIKGRQQEGTGAKTVDLKTVEGVPFKVPTNADSKMRSQLIKEHLATLNIGVTHPEYAKKFAELNTKILQGQTQAA